MSVQFVAYPPDMATAIKNVLNFTKETGRGKKGSPDILLRLERDDRSGELAAVGVARHAAARDWLEVQGAGGDEVAEVLLLGRQPNKTEEIDDLWKLAMAIDKTSKAKGSQVFVEIHHRHKVTVEFGGQLVGELGDTGGDTTPHAWVQDQLDKDGWGQLAGPTAFMVDTFARVKDIKTDASVIDVAQLPGDKEKVAIQAGPTFMGLMSTVDRDLFSRGGPWGDGPGSPDQLLTGVEAGAAA